MLYWFRTPPGVRVGRAAIDEQAMRLLEQHNPDVEFDWPRLLRDAPPDQGPRRERDRDPRDRDRRERRDQRPPARPRPDTTAAAVPPIPPPARYDTTAEIADARADAHADRLLAPDGDDANGATPIPDSRSPIPVPRSPASESLALTHGEPLAADHAEYEEYAEAARTDPSSLIPDPESPAAVRLGREGVSRLRARYAQLVARLAEKPMEDELRAELKVRLERLNPDAWQTPDEVAAALEQYEAVFESLRAHIGHQPRRKL